MTERWFTDQRMLAHTAPAGYPEVPERLEAVLEAGDARVAASVASFDRAASEDSAADTRELGDDQDRWTDILGYVRAVHDEGYVARFQAAAVRGDGVLDSADNPMSPGTWEAACAAVRATTRAAAWMAAGNERHAFAAVRPPGHHAERDRAMGFCFFANIAVAAQMLIDEHGMDRVAIVDFDVHHGNGTQHIFESRPDVLFISLHQYPLYPGTGAGTERGLGAGEGATVNIPLAAGTGDEGYAEAFASTVVPCLDDFRPQAILVSAGLDAWKGDPLGGMQVGLSGFHHWGKCLGDAANRLAHGRLLSALEGGYDVASMNRVAQAYLDGVAGLETPTTGDEKASASGECTTS